MSRFRFIHAADLHLGSPLRGLALKDAGIAARFAAAGREALSALVDQAIERRVAFVIVAGDVYDGEWQDNAIGLFFAREMARLAREGIRVFLVRGNHDAASVVTKTITLPDNVREFSTAKAETVEIEPLRVALHGRGFAQREAPENLALAYPAPRPGFLNIGVLHTSADGRPPHATYAPCSLDDLRLRGYDYWALGHVHEHEVLSRDPWIVFPGNLQGRSVRECGARGAMLVDVEDGRIAGVERLIVDRARWARLQVDVTGTEEESEALGRVGEALAAGSEAAGDRLMAVRVELAGATPLHSAWAADPARLAAEVEAALQRIHPDAWLERVKVDTRGPRAAGTGEAAGLGAIDLAAMLEGIEADGELAERAAQLLEAVTAKLPGGIDRDEAPSADDLPDLVAAARELVLARAGGR